MIEFIPEDLLIHLLEGALGGLLALLSINAGVRVWRLSLSPVKRVAKGFVAIFINESEPTAKEQCDNLLQRLDVVQENIRNQLLPPDDNETVQRLSEAFREEDLKFPE